MEMLGGGDSWDMMPIAALHRFTRLVQHETCLERSLGAGHQSGEHMSSRHLFLHKSLAMYLSVLLTACGGGSDGAQTTEPPPNVQPVITLSQNELSFDAIAGGENPTSRPVQITNGGNGTLSALSAVVSYNAGQTEGWLTTTLAVATAPTTILVQPLTGALVPGTYNASVELRSAISNVAAKRVAVTFVVAPPPTGWVSLHTASAFRPYPPGFVRLSADDQRIAVFYGFRDPSLSFSQGEVIEFRRSTNAWTFPLHGDNNAKYDPDITTTGPNSFAVVYDTDELDVRGAIVDTRGSFGLGVNMLENQTEPNVAHAMGTAFVSFIVNGRLHVRYSIAHSQSTSLPERTGGLGQASGDGFCVLTLSCIQATSIAGDANAWYAAMVEAAGCISVETSTRTASRWLGPCFHVSGRPIDPQLHIRDGKPTVVFREGTSLYVAEWRDAEWFLVGEGTLQLTTVVRSAVVGPTLVLLQMDRSGADPRILVERFDGTTWSAYPAGAELSGSTLSDADVGLYRGSPVVGLIENGHIAIRWLIPSAGTVASTRSMTRGTSKVSARGRVGVLPQASR